MRVLIATGIYPPAVGGPAQYAQSLEGELLKLGHQVRVLTYGFERYLPAGVRHLWFFCRALSALAGVDLVIVLDTFSVALPTVLANKFFGQRLIIRTGGDFLWESYVQRTGDMVLLRHFYNQTPKLWSIKERFVFFLTRWTLRQATCLVFSTNWQRELWQQPYALRLERTAIVENYFPPVQGDNTVTDGVFVSGGRQIRLKNWDRLKRVFESLHLTLELVDLPHPQLIERLKSCHALVLVSLSEISPNLALDAIGCGKPVILTRETGLRERLGDVVIWADPLDEEDIKAKVMLLANPDHYREARQRAQQFNFTHSWGQIADEFIALANKL